MPSPRLGLDVREDADGVDCPVHGCSFLGAERMSLTRWTAALKRSCLLLWLAWGTFAAGADSSVTTGWLMLGDGWQTPYYIKQAVEPGPVVMILGGVHGDEPAGAAAANNIRHWDVTRGTLIVVPSAAPQALAARTRTIPNEGDLNRNFPGFGESIAATSGPTAAAIWAFVRAQSPQWLLDLHEGYDFRSSNPESVGSSVIHANEPVTKVYVDRMLAAVNQEISDPGKLFVSLSGPVDKSVARASVLHLGTRGMIVETTTKNQPLTLRVDQHRGIVSQFLADQQMIAAPFGGSRGSLLDDFTFDEPDGMTLAKVGNSLPHGAAWSVSPFDSRMVDGQFRIQRTASGTSTTTTGMLGAGLIRVRSPVDATRLSTDVSEGFATMVVAGWDFRSVELGETIRFGFRSTLSPDVNDTAQIVLQRTGVDEVSLSGVGYGSGSGNIAPAVVFGSLQRVPVQFVLRLNKQENLDGSPVSASATTGGFYEILYQMPGQDFVEVGAGAAVRQLRNGDFMAMQIAGPIGANGGFFDIDRLAYSTAIPATLLPDPAAGPVSLEVDVGRMRQAQVGYPTIPSAASVTKTGLGTMVFHAGNGYKGPTAVSAGTLEVAHPQALGSTSVTVGTGATLEITPGVVVQSPAVTVAGGILRAQRLDLNSATGIAALAINAGTLADDPVVAITTGGRLSLAADSRVTVAFAGLAVDQAAGGRLDIGSGQITVAAGGITAAELRADLITGRSGGTWAGTGGITSTAAAASRGARTVGYRIGSDGVALITYAAAGDANLDGQVNVFDLVGMIGSGKYGTGGTAIWSEGDFNYDGLTDVFDLVGIEGSGVYGKGKYMAFGTAGAGPAAVVPEPAWWGLGVGGFGFGSIGLAMKRLVRRGGGSRQRWAANLAPSVLWMARLGWCLLVASGMGLVAGPAAWGVPKNENKRGPAPAREPGTVGSKQPGSPPSDDGLPSPDQAAAGFGMPEDFRVELFAAEPDLANPVAFTVDEQGRVFVCETYRQAKGVTDNRGQSREWVDADLASQSVADREAYHRRLLGPEAAEWETHDDRVRLLVDEDGDGRADRSSVYAAGFNRLIDGTAAGLLGRRGELFLTCIPAVYRLRDLDGDGHVDRGPPEREIVSEGYGCRVAYRGHDLHGLVLGPDGKLYFSVGDRGYRVEHTDGLATEPGRGAVFRCRPDGTEFEVFATGLRNPQELAFDDYGNLFTVDNNCDGGDKARLVHLLPGGDSGWTMEYQYLSDRGPWNREGMWKLPHDGQPLWLVPPLAHLGAGPSGLAAYPGTGLPARFSGRFLICDFRGGAAQSSVRSFTLEPAGGSFRVTLDEETFRGLLATDVEFGPDGAVWVSDWVHGWFGEGAGRIWRFVPKNQDAAAVADVRTLLAGEWALLEQDRLVGLLGHADRRLRLEAQWELGRRGEWNAFRKIVAGGGPLLPRVHAIWGLAGSSEDGLNPVATSAIQACLGDPAAEIRAVACRTLGDLPHAGQPPVIAQLADLLDDSDPQVRVAAGIALGRLGDRRLTTETGDMILTAAARDAHADGFLRHGIVSAMAGGFDDESLGRAAADPNAGVRLAACLAMRRRHDPRIAGFLTDLSPIAAEAVRAIHDLPLPSLLPALAARLAQPQSDPELARRMVSAAERVGTQTTAALLAATAAAESMPVDARVLAIKALGDWAAPPDRNRVDGRWQPHAPNRDPAMAWAAFEAVLPHVLANAETRVQRATLDALASLDGGDVTTMLADVSRDERWEPLARGVSLELLARRDPAAALLAATTLRGNAAWAVRAAAKRVLASHDPAGVLADLECLLADLAAPVPERQAAVELVATLDGSGARAAVESLAERLESGVLDPALALEVRDAARQRLERELAFPGTGTDPLAGWSDALMGGDPARGRAVFFGNVEASCVRCHRVEGTGGEVGPVLDGIGGHKDARYLLESIVLPDAQVAAGFQTTVVITAEGRAVSGIVVTEDDERLMLRSPENRLLEIPQDSIEERVVGPSAMPADLVGKITRRELRDLVAWLASLRGPVTGPAAIP
jgi:quinoprotein glucose dehydrogenase